MFKAIDYNVDSVEFTDLANLDNDFPGGDISKQQYKNVWKVSFQHCMKISLGNVAYIETFFFSFFFSKFFVSTKTPRINLFFISLFLLINFTRTLKYWRIQVLKACFQEILIVFS